MARKKKEKEEVLVSPAEAVMEKSGKLVLNSKEYTEIQKGTVPARIKEEWGLTLTEARDMLQCSFYELTR